MLDTLKTELSKRETELEKIDKELTQLCEEGKRKCEETNDNATEFERAEVAILAIKVCSYKETRDRLRIEIALLKQLITKFSN